MVFRLPPVRCVSRGVCIFLQLIGNIIQLGLRFMLDYHSNGAGAGADFRLRLVCRLACHRPDLSQVGVSGKLCAVQFNVDIFTHETLKIGPEIWYTRHQRRGVKCLVFRALVMLLRIFKSL